WKLLLVRFRLLLFVWNFGELADAGGQVVAHLHRQTAVVGVLDGLALRPGDQILPDAGETHHTVGLGVFLGELLTDSVLTAVSASLSGPLWAASPPCSSGTCISFCSTSSGAALPPSSLFQGPSQPSLFAARRTWASTLSLG